MTTRSDPAPRVARRGDPASWAACIVRRLPIYRGGGYLAARPVLQRLALREPRVTWGRLRGGGLIRLDRTDLVGRTVFYFGDFSREITHIASRVLRPGDTMLDIGANIAETALQCARVVGPTGQVHAFEPNPAIADLIEESRSRNGFHHLVVHRVALGEHEDTLKLHIPKGNLGAGSLVRHADDAEIECISAPVRPFASVAREYAIPRARFVKLDVEGFEAPAIAGAKDLWANEPPAVIVYEVNATDATLDHHEATTALRDLGYVLYRIVRRWGPPRIEPITDLFVPATAHGNDLVAVHSGVDPEALARLINR